MAALASLRLLERRSTLAQSEDCAEKLNPPTTALIRIIVLHGPSVVARSSNSSILRRILPPRFSSTFFASPKKSFNIWFLLSEVKFNVRVLACARLEKDRNVVEFPLGHYVHFFAVDDFDM